MREGFELIAGFSRYAVNKQGIVWDTKKDKEIKSKFKKYPRVKLKIGNSELSVIKPVVWLVADIFLELPDHLKEVNKMQLKIIHLDDDENNVKLENLCYFHLSEWNNETIDTPYKRKRIAEVLKKGYTIIPSVCNYAINKEGKVICMLNNSRVSKSGKGEKKYVTLYHAKKRREKRTIISLLEETYPEEFKM